MAKKTYSHKEESAPKVAERLFFFESKLVNSIKINTIFAP